MSNDEKMSRRRWLKKTALITVAVAASPLTGLAARAASNAKVSKASVHYQDHPDNGRMCMMCRYFISSGGSSSGMDMGGMMGRMGPGMMADGTCRRVVGKISPMGYCELYTPLQG